MRPTLQMMIIGAVAVAGATFPASPQSMEGQTIVPVQEIKWGSCAGIDPPRCRSSSPLRRSEQGGRVLALAPSGGSKATTSPRTPIPSRRSSQSYLERSGSAWETRPIGARHSCCLREHVRLCARGWPTSFTPTRTRIIQLNSNGPWGITYVNPKDDPRQKK